MAAMSNLIMTFLIVACALHIQFIYRTQNYQELIQKKHFELAVQQMPMLNEMLSQLHTIGQIQQDMHKQRALQEMFDTIKDSLNHIQNRQKMQEKQYEQLVHNLQSQLLLNDCSTAPITGQYKISLGNKKVGSFSVYCDMNTTPSGWIVFQRRFDGSVDFDRNWVEYEDGFGSLAGEFWLGLKKLHMLTSQNKWEVRVDLEDFRGNHVYALYDDFKVGDSSSLYRLTLGSYSGTAGDSMISQTFNGTAFTTKDKDNDDWSDGNCGVLQRSGWWHRYYTRANLNGLYRGQDGDSLTGMCWWTWKQWQSLKKSEIKIRPIN